MRLTVNMIRSKKVPVTDLFTDFAIDDANQYRGEGKPVTYKLPNQKLDYDSNFPS